MAWASEAERDERFRVETPNRRPAEKGDIRFEITELFDSMEETPFVVELVDDTGTVVETHYFATSAEVYSMVEAHRYAQARRAEADRLGVHPLEIEFAPFGPAWEREQEDRRRGV